MIKEEKNDAIMASLSKKLSICSTFLAGKTVFLDYPVHSNVGDLLIWKGTETFFTREKINIIGRYSFRLGYLAHKTMKESDTICFQGGGNFGDIYTNCQATRIEVIEKYPDKKIVILPQSVHYNSEQNLQMDCEVLRKHTNLHIFLRDEQSLEILKKWGITNVHLCPDMAHALWQNIVSNNIVEQKILYLLRRDSERSALPSDVQRHEKNSFDWPDLIKDPYNLLLYELGYTLDKIDGRRMGNYIPLTHWIWKWESQRLINQAIEVFSKHEKIITNRLHAVILSVLLRKHATAYDNSYGKVSSYIKLWLSDHSQVFFPNQEIYQE